MSIKQAEFPGFKDHFEDLVLHCRPEWKKFARGQKESGSAYEERLRQTFSFSQSVVKEQPGPFCADEEEKPRHLQMPDKEAALPRGKWSRGKAAGARLQHPKRSKVSLASS